MPNTTRGYPYESGADQPGHSLTGGSNGASPILAQVLDADVGAIDARLTAAEGDISDGAVELDAHEADTTDVHGITDTADLVYTGDARLSDARTPTAHASTHATGGTDPITPGDIGAYPDTGGEVDGDVTLTDHNFTVRKADGMNAWRARSTGGAIDFDTVGDVTVTAWGGADFTGSETARQRWHVGGITYGGVVSFGSTIYTDEQLIHNTDFYAKLGGKNGIDPIQVCGRTDTPGAPAAGTWDTGDLVFDSDGVAHVCIAGGTPGTWT